MGQGSNPVQRVTNWLRWRLVERSYPLNAFRGIYSTFAEARAQAPDVKPVGYDSANTADWYSEKHHQVGLDDYPVVFWMRYAFANSNTVLEIGGHVGVAYYGFQQVLRYPDNLTWTIVDVPSIVAAGRALAAERKRTNVQFIDDVAKSSGADILLAAGALQYVDPSLADIVSRFDRRPKHILINTTPVYTGPAFVTLQNIGTAYCPYRIFNRQELLDSLAALGYSLKAEWKKDRALQIPDRPDRSFDHYSGFYLELTS